MRKSVTHNASGIIEHFWKNQGQEVKGYNNKSAEQQSYLLKNMEQLPDSI